MSWDLCAQCNLCQEHGLCHWHKKQACPHDDCAHYIPLQQEPLCCRKVSGNCSLLPQDVFDPWIQVHEIKIGKLFLTFLLLIHKNTSIRNKNPEKNMKTTTNILLNDLLSNWGN